MKIPIVNEQDEIIGFKERGEINPEDISRIVVLHVFNEKFEILIAKRQSTKIIHPDKWGPSVSGGVEEGYDYDTTVTKEAEEEIGLKNISPIFYKKMPKLSNTNSRFTGVYYVVINSKEKLILQEDEVAEIKWISVSGLEKWFIDRPEDFVPSFGRSMNIIKELYAEITK